MAVLNNAAHNGQISSVLMPTTNLGKISSSVVPERFVSTSHPQVSSIMASEFGSTSQPYSTISLRGKD